MRTWCALVALFALLSEVGHAQTDSVSGVVTSMVSGLPLAGVSVRLKGTSQRTTSNAAGRYTVQVPSLSDTLHFSLIGYHPQDVPIAGRSEVDVQLAALPAQLEAQVVTAYRVQDRGTVTGAVSSVSGADVSNVPVDNLSNALQGRLSGVSVTQNAGTPGRESNIQIGRAHV